MKFIKELDLMPMIIILLCCTNTFLLMAYKNTNNSLHNVATEVPKIAKDSYATGCLNAMYDFSNKSEDEISSICSQGANDFSAPIEHLFNGTN